MVNMARLLSQSESMLRAYCTTEAPGQNQSRIDGLLVPPFKIVRCQLASRVFDPDWLTYFGAFGGPSPQGHDLSMAVDLGEHLLPSTARFYTSSQ